MNRTIGSHFGNLVEYWQAREIERREQVEHETRLSQGAALIIIATLSLALWWLIWLAVSALASVFSG